MLTDRGVAPGLRAEELDVRWFGGCDWLHLSGYSLLRRPIEEAAAKAAGAIQAQGGASASTSRRRRGSPSTGRRSFSAGSSCSGPTLVFANESELAAIGGDVRATLVLKRGADGFSRRRRGTTPRCRPTSSTRPARATRSRPASSSAGRSSPLEAAARCVAQLGAMP